MGKEYKVVGITRYIDNIMKQAIESEDYQLPKNELVELYSAGDRVEKYYFDFVHAELVQEPENPYDSNAIRVELDGDVIGYVPREDAVEVLDVMNSGDFAGIKITNIHYGDFKELIEDENGNIQIKNDRYNYPFARFQLLSKADRPVPVPKTSTKPAAKAQQRREPVVIKRTKAQNNVLMILSILLILLGLLLTLATPIGLLFVIIGIVLIVISRRK